jgi:hypothetical protein
MPRPRKKAGLMGLCGCFRPNSPDEINIGKKYKLIFFEIIIFLKLKNRSLSPSQIYRKRMRCKMLCQARQKVVNSHRYST